MLSQEEPDDRQKVTFKLPSSLKADLKIRAAELGIDIQDAVATAMDEWRAASPDGITLVDTAGAPPFATWLTDPVITQFKTECSSRGIPYVQGLAQAVTRWLDAHPSHRHRPPEQKTRRIVVCNQKGGVGKTAVTSGLGGALAEDRQRALAAGGPPRSRRSRPPQRAPANDRREARS